MGEAGDGACTASATARSGYRRREPGRTLLHATVRAHLKRFLAEMEQGDGAGLPGFVTSEFERLPRVRILAHGFARVRCSSCGDEILVAFTRWARFLLARDPRDGLCMRGAKTPEPRAYAGDCDARQLACPHRHLGTRRWRVPSPPPCVCFSALAHRGFHPGEVADCIADYFTRAQWSEARANLF